MTMPTATHKIYYDDPHIVDFSATVLSCEMDPQTGNLYVVLDKTAFFPEEGGQKPDTGTMEGFTVLDVQIKDNVIVHTLQGRCPDSPENDSPAAMQKADEILHHFAAGRVIAGQVDWAQRFDFMQQHSGEHILSGLAHAKYGCNNVGFHLGYEEVTMDFDQVLSWEQIRELEVEANRIIQQNLPVLASFPSKEVLADMNYRSKLDLTDNIRIVEIPGVDLCACCAPHVDFTGQIGMFKVVALQNHRGGVRLNILCSMRALRDYTLYQDYVTDVSVLLSAKPEKIGEAVRRVKTESQTRQERINALQARMLTQKIEALADAPDSDANCSTTAPTPILLFEDKMDAKALRDAVNLLTAKFEGYCCIFSGNDGEGYFYVAGSRNLDCREIAALLREKCGAKGGGSALMVQGNVTASKETLEALFR